MNQQVFRAKGKTKWMSLWVRVKGRMVEDVRPSQLFRVLTSTSCSLADKLELALQAWTTDAIDFPKKAVFLTQWALELAGGKSKECAAPMPQTF